MAITLYCAAIYLVLVAPSAFGEFPTSCRSQEIRKDQIDALIERRATTFKHCLVCEGQTCQMKNWPVSGAEFADRCKVLFCTPQKIPRSAITPEDADQNGSFGFTYTIGKKGRVKDIRITEVSGDIEPKTALRLANATYKRRKYVPVVVDGKSYGITNLVDSMRLTIDLDVRVRR